MSSTSTQAELRVIVAADRRTAELFIPADSGDCPHDQFTVDTCLALLAGAGVEITPAGRAAVADLLAQAPVPGQPRRAVVARARAPQPGQDGRIEWAPAHASADATGTVNHYERSPYVMVKQGDVLGQIHAPTAGVDGRDVLGHALAAPAGRLASLRRDDTLALDSAGRLVAQADGVLVHQGDRAVIRQLLEVSGSVDFSTGNVDFAGEVVVHQGVRDLFVVKTGGNLTVCHLIEAATIECGGDLLAQGGMAARLRGSLEVAGCTAARYLDAVAGNIKGNLRVEREIINCELQVLGSVLCPTGLLVGGRLVVVGRAEFATVGSPAGVATELVLGSVPTLEPFARQLAALLEELNARLAALEAEIKTLSADARRRTSVDKERQTELLFEKQGLQDHGLRGRLTLDALRHMIQTQRTIHLTVHTCLHAGVTITVDGASYRLSRDLHGPVVVCKDGGDVVYRHGQGEQAQAGLLAQAAQVKVGP